MIPASASLEQGSLRRERPVVPASLHMVALLMACLLIVALLVAPAALGYGGTVLALWIAFAAGAVLLLAQGWSLAAWLRQNARRQARPPAGPHPTVSARGASVPRLR